MFDACALHGKNLRTKTDVEPGDVPDLFGRMRRRGATTSAIKLRAALSALFAIAVDDILLSTDPVTGVRIPVAPSGDEPDEEQEDDYDKTIWYDWALHVCLALSAP
jgi:hypothetical protein